MLCRLSEEVLGLSEHTDMVVVGALIELVLVRSGEFPSRTEADERKSRVDAVGLVRPVRYISCCSFTKPWAAHE
jgi:hypothetical protein